MSSEGFEELFHELVDLPVPERDIRLEALGRRDPALRDELSALIRAFWSSSSFLEPSDLLPYSMPDRLSRYRILGELGRGAAGIVYLAEDPDLDRRIAIKTLTLRTTDGTAPTLLREEARALAAVVHPNIAQVHSIETIDPDATTDASPLAFLTMEYVPGGTLAERLHDTPLPLESALDYARQIAAALEAAHTQSIIHRDLKPANIRVTDDGWVKVLDFGLATLASTGAPVAKAAGTPGYMSPEQCRGDAIDLRSDLWSFGAVLYECLTGVPATSGETLIELLEANRRGEVDLARLPDTLPAGITELIRSCLQADPTRRNVTAGGARLLLEEALLRLRVAALPGSDPGTPAPRGNLPRPISSFVGRREFLDKLSDRLREHRLVTLTGPGGVGKTRTAIEAAGRARGAFPGGCWFVDLSELAHGSDVHSAVARVLHPRDASRAATPDDYARAIAGQMADAPTLLLLDCCEHVIDATIHFVENLLAECLALTVLATSRQPLGIEGEEIVTLAPLTIPREGIGDADEGSTEAVELFLKRARGSLQAGSLTPAERALVHDICRRVDGLPLAIELAASHARALPLSEIQRRIVDGESLADLSARRPARHRSMRDLVEWSYRLLPQLDRTLLRRLSIFRGGCALADVEVVCVGSGIAAWQVYERMARLVERSLVDLDPESTGSRSDPSGSVRYRMIDSIRSFAASRLEAEPGERESVETRYLEHLIRIAALRPGEEGPTSSNWVRRIEPDYPNLLHGLDLALARGERDRAFLIGGRLCRYWLQTGSWAEGLEWMERLLTLDHEEDRPEQDPSSSRSPHPRDRIEVLSQTARLAASMGQREKAAALAGRAVELARELNEPASLAQSLQSDGVAAWFRTDIATARARFEEALVLYEAIADRGGRAVCLANLGAVHSVNGDHETALGYHRASLALCREMGDRLAEAKGLLNLGRTEIMLGRPDVARTWLEEALAIHVRDRDPGGIAMTHHHLGDLELSRGRLEQARAHLLESARIRVRIGDLPAATSVLTSIAQAMDLQGESVRAAEIVACVLRRFAMNEISHLPGQIARLEALRDGLAARLGSSAMAVATVRGESRGVADLVEWVAEIDSTVRPPRPWKNLHEPPSALRSRPGQRHRRRRAVRAGRRHPGHPFGSPLARGHASGDLHGAPRACFLPAPRGTMGPHPWADRIGPRSLPASGPGDPLRDAEPISPPRRGRQPRCGE